MRVILTFLVLFWGCQLNAQTMYSFTSKKNNRLIFERYDFNNKYDTVSIDNIQIVDTLVSSLIYYDLKAFRIQLLEKGYGKLIDRKKAKFGELTAENDARDRRLNIWSKSKPDTTSNKKNIQVSSEENIVVRYARRGWLYLVKLFQENWITGLTYLLGVAATIFFSLEFIKILYSKWRERNLTLLLLGDTATGKTSLLYTLHNPDLEPEQIKRVQLSQATNIKKSQNKIFRGRFEFTPVICDVPGSQPSEQAEKLILEKNDIIIYLISFTKAFKNADAAINNKFIDQQFGSLKAHLGVLMSKAQKKKPKILVLYLSKFDLIADASPKDTTSKTHVDNLTALFKDHISIANAAAKKLGIPFMYVFGSATEKWNSHDLCEQIIEKLIKEKILKV